MSHRFTVASPDAPPLALRPRRHWPIITTAAALAAVWLGGPMALNAATGPAPEDIEPMVLGADTAFERTVENADEPVECVVDPMAMSPGSYECEHALVTLRVAEDVDNPEKVLRRMHRASRVVVGDSDGVELKKLGDTTALIDGSDSRLSYVLPTRHDGTDVLVFVSYSPTTPYGSSPELLNSIQQSINGQDAPRDLQEELDAFTAEDEHLQRGATALL